MKRKIITAAIAILLLLAAGYYISLPDYEVVNSMSFSSQNTRDSQAHRGRTQQGQRCAYIAGDQPVSFPLVSETWYRAVQDSEV